MPSIRKHKCRIVKAHMQPLPSSTYGLDLDCTCQRDDLMHNVQESHLQIYKGQPHLALKHILASNVAPSSYKQLVIYFCYHPIDFHYS